MTRVWCPDCRAMVELVDESAEEGKASGREFVWWVQRLGCGHAVSHEQSSVPAGADA